MAKKRRKGLPTAYAPKTPSEIRCIARRLRTQLGVENIHAPDILRVLGDLPSVLPNFKLKVVPDLRLPHMEARAFGNICLLKTCESVMNAIRYYGDPRGRWTIAHELGHLVLRHPGTQPRHRPDQALTGTVAIFEYEANIFASEFLVPTDLVREDFSIEKITRIFQVSSEAATRRKRELEAEKNVRQKILPDIHRTTALVPSKFTGGRVAFISMAYSPAQMTRLYQEIIKPAVESSGLICLRADEISSIDTIANDIRRAIDECILAIAEISESNLNVMHEIGLAQSIDKPVIIICRNECNVPSNISGLRRILYSNDAGGGPMLRRDLEIAIDSILSVKALRTN